MKKILLLTALAALSLSANAQFGKLTSGKSTSDLGNKATKVAAEKVQEQLEKLSPFGAELGKQTVGDKLIRVPYTDVVSIFDFVEREAKPDAVKGGRKYFYYYVYVPIAVPELGIRMISPVPSEIKPKENDYVTESYKANLNNKWFFDPRISFDKAVDVLTKADVAKGKPSKWQYYGMADNSNELPAQPDGLKNNALLYNVSDVKDLSKALTAGVYRIGFTNLAEGNYNGSFLAQIGSPVKLPGVIIAKTFEELQSKIK